MSQLTDQQVADWYNQAHTQAREANAAYGESSPSDPHYLDKASTRARASENEMWAAKHARRPRATARPMGARRRPGHRPRQ